MARLLIILVVALLIAFVPAPPMAHAAAALGNWTLTGSMSTARAYHTLTLLPNGSVLVTGGVDAQNAAQATAEQYDPATGVWTSTASMSEARSDQSATLLPNGKVLIAGGYDTNDSTATSELYDPTTQTWTPTGSMHTARYGHGAVLLANGKVLAMGGWAHVDEATASVEIYDPASGLWTSMGDLNAPRAGPTPILLPNGKVLLVGGELCCPYSAYNTAEIFDPATNIWTLTAPMSIAPISPSATLLPSGRILVAGGHLGVCCPWTQEATPTAELYDPTTNTWKSTGNLNQARAFHISVLLPNGDVLVTGGQGEFTTPLASAEVYDTESGMWFPAGSMLVPRDAAHAAVLLPSGQVLEAGGRNLPDNNAMASAELFDPTAPTDLPVSEQPHVPLYHAYLPLLQ